MDFELRQTIRKMPYRKRYHGLSAGEIYDLKRLEKFTNYMIRFSDVIPISPLRNVVLIFTMMLAFISISVLCVDRITLAKVNKNNNKTDCSIPLTKRNPGTT